LGADPEMKYTTGGQPVAKFSIATSENWTDKSGQKQERTEWHRIVVWGKLAEICGKHLSKGRQAYIEGKLQTRQWEDQQGQKRWTTEVIGQIVQFLGSPSGYTSREAGRGEAAQESHATSEFGAEPQFNADEEIPF
jgi:single-strand DNA-binding protein